MKKTLSEELCQLYFRFRLLINGINSLPEAQGLPQEAQSLLDRIGQTYYSGESATVLGLINMKELGAPATIHKRLQLLKQAGFVDVQVSNSDGRVKFVTPTKRAIEYFTASGCVINEFKTQ